VHHQDGDIDPPDVLVDLAQTVEHTRRYRTCGR